MGSLLDETLRGLRQDAIKVCEQAIVIVVLIIMLLLVLAIFFVWLDLKTNKPLYSSVWLRLVKVIT